MSHTRTRFFLLGSTAVLVGGLAAGTAAYLSGVHTPAFASQAGPDDLALVPAGAAMVAYANVQDVMQSEFRQRLTAAVDAKSEGRLKFHEETGIDLERDIDSVVAAATPDTGGSAQEFGFVALRGRFDTTRIEALVSARGGVLDEYRGARLLLPAPRASEDAASDDVVELAPSPRRHGRPGLALVDANLVMVGTMDALKAAIDRHHDQGPSILSDGEFVRMLENLDSGSTMWAIARSSVLMGVPGDASSQVASKLPGVKWVAASGHVNGGLRATVQAEAKDAEAGRNLREIVQGALAIARLQADGQPELQPLLRSLQVEGTGTGVSVRVEMPAQLIEVLLGHVQRHAGRAGDHGAMGTPAEE